MDAPWIPKRELAVTDKFLKLHKEICAFEKYIEPTTREIRDRERLVDDIKEIVEDLWPGQYNVVPFGSVESGLLFPSSDVDINIEPVDPEYACEVKSMLRAIHKRGMKQRLFYYQETTLVLHAKVPILTVKRSSGASVDISIANDICSSRRTISWIKKYAELKPLFMVLKQAISHCRLTSNPAFEPLSAKTNGLASYGLICLIVHYLQHEKPKDIEQNHYYASLLMGFLTFYGSFKETLKGILMQENGGCYALNSNKIPPVEFKVEEGKLLIVDPDKDVNVARSCSNFNFLKLIMNHLLELIEKRMRTASIDESILSSIIKVDAHYYNEARRQGDDFKSESIIIENGNPVIKTRFNGKQSNRQTGLRYRAKNNYNNHSNEHYNDRARSNQGHHQYSSRKPYYPYPRQENHQREDSDRKGHWNRKKRNN